MQNEKREVIERLLYACLGIYFFLCAFGIIHIPESVTTFFSNLTGLSGQSDLQKIHDFVGGFGMLLFLFGLLAAGLAPFIRRKNFENDYGAPGPVGLALEKIATISHRKLYALFRWGMIASITVILGSGLTLLMTILHCEFELFVAIWGNCFEPSLLLYLLATYFGVLACIPKNIKLSQSFDFT